MADMLERIAKEVGDVRREVTGQGSGPLRMEYSELSDEQLDARIAQLLGSGIATGEGGGSAGR